MASFKLPEVLGIASGTKHTMSNIIIIAALYAPPQRTRSAVQSLSKANIGWVL